jgi:hypothetical protein
MNDPRSEDVFLLIRNKEEMRKLTLIFYNNSSEDLYGIFEMLYGEQVMKEVEKTCNSWSAVEQRNDRYENFCGDASNLGGI